LKTPPLYEAVQEKHWICAMARNAGAAMDQL
jgi:hypothetical protein